MNSHNEKEDDQQIVMKYFRLIDEKDMSSLLNLFTEDLTFMNRLAEIFVR